MKDQTPKEHATILAARALLSRRFHGMLATQSTGHPGYPFGSAVPFSLDPSGSPLVLLSHLAEHTRNLERDPRCSLLLMDEGGGDVQQLARLTLLAEAHAVEAPDPTLVERHFRYYPQGRAYFEELNFRFFRLEPGRAHFVGGFGTARWLAPGQLNDPLRFDPGEEVRLLGLVNGELMHHLHRVYRSTTSADAGSTSPCPAGKRCSRRSPGCDTGHSPTKLGVETRFASALECPPYS
jgi:hypothetical protein